MNQTAAEVNQPDLETALRRVSSLSEIPLLISSLFLSEEYGYGPDAWGPLEGSGHSVYTVVAIWMVFNVLTLSGIQKAYSAKEKMAYSLMIALGIEFGLPMLESINSVADPKDGLAIVLTGAMLLLLEQGLQKLSAPAVKKIIRNAMVGK